MSRPREEKVLHELAREVVLLTHEIVRSRFSVATDPAVFQAVSYRCQMLGGGTWPDSIQDALSLLIKDVREALVLLGRQGVRDQGLLEQLDMLCNYPQRARAIAKDIAERHQELDEETRQWLDLRPRAGSSGKRAQRHRNRCFGMWMRRLASR